jgi:hypothetical protein
VEEINSYDYEKRLLPDEDGGFVKKQGKFTVNGGCQLLNGSD